MNKRKLLVGYLLFLLALSFLGFLDFMPPVLAVFGSEDIFFEYGAEAGYLQPPWDAVGASGSGSTSGAGAIVDNSHVRTGTQAVKLYQPALPKSDAQRRVSAYYHSYSESEFYFSFWAYFPTGYDNVADSASWLNIGGITLYWGNNADSGGRWSKGLRSRFTVGKDGTGFFARGTWSANDRTGDWVDFWYNGAKEYLTLNTWVHFQIYMKSGESDGVITAWIDNNVSLNRTSEPTDPAYWGEPEVGDVWSHGNQYYSLGITQYGDQTTTPALEVWYDDMVGATEKVTESYGVQYASTDFEIWEEGFEDGNSSFPRWNGVSTNNAEVNVTSTVKYQGSYSANFTTNDGTSGSYAQLMKEFQPANEMFMASWVRFPETADTNSRNIYFLRFANSSGDWIVLAGLRRTSGGSDGWVLRAGGTTSTNTTTATTVNVWHRMEIRLKTGSSGVATLWINNTLTLNVTGDFSAYGQVAQAFPRLYLEGSQTDSKTVFQDNFAVDDERIGLGIPRIFQGLVYFSTGGEDAQGDFSPLQYVTINGTRATDLDGLYKWTNLTYNEVYTFVVGNATGYYPAWVLNVEGSFSWNGTDYLLSHNVTEGQTGYLQIYFLSTSQPYINYTNAKLTSASYSNNTMYVTANHTDSREIDIYSTARPTFLLGKNYSASDYASNILNITYTFSASKTFTLSWETLGGITFNSTTAEISATPTFTIDYKLTFKVNKTSGTSNTTIYHASLGDPHTVIGASSWSYNNVSKILSVIVAHSSEVEVAVLWGTWTFTFKGPYNEATGLLFSGGVNVTAYYINMTTTSFTVDGTFYFATNSSPLYFSFDLSPFNREYWVSTGENSSTIYIANASTTLYTVSFLDLAGALDTYPFVEAQHYLNGTLRTVEKRKVDEQKKIIMALVTGEKYTLIIKDGSDYTFGDLLMTSTTSFQLTLKGIEFPENILLAYQYVRMYADRHNNLTSISMLYEDTLSETTNVNSTVYFENGTIAYTNLQVGVDTFNVTWASANYSLSYYAVMTSNHGNFGELVYKTTLPRGYTSNPWAIDWLGELPNNISTSTLIPLFVVLAVFAAFGRMNAFLGIFLGISTVALFVWIGWFNVPVAMLVVALMFTILYAFARKRRTELGE